MAPKARGELGEIRATLATLATTGNAKSEAVVASKRDVFKKVINYMTIGIDMSSLFMQARWRRGQALRARLGAVRHNIRRRVSAFRKKASVLGDLRR
jgi:hypothetical protein